MQATYVSAHIRQSPDILYIKNKLLSRMSGFYLISVMGTQNHTGNIQLKPELCKNCVDMRILKIRNPP